MDRENKLFSERTVIQVVIVYIDGTPVQVQRLTTGLDLVQLFRAFQLDFPKSEIFIQITVS